MPRFTFKTQQEQTESLIDIKERLLTENELKWYKDKLTEISEKYGYGLDNRQGGAAALRMYILATTNCKLEDVIDLSKLSHDEYVGYLKGFFDMMDDSKRDKKECAKDLAKMHKKAFEKIKDYKIENLRTDNIEYVAKSYDFSGVLRSMYIQYSQDMQNLRSHKPDSKYNEVRKAYESEYPAEEAGLDEERLSAAVNGLFSDVFFCIDSYNKNQYKDAAFHLDVVRFSAPDMEGKKIGEIPFHKVYIANITSENSIPATEEEVPIYEDFLAGVSGTYPNSGNFDNHVNTQLDQAVHTSGNNSFDKKLKAFVKKSFQPYLSYISPEMPEDLLILSDEQINELEKAFHDTFGELYHGVERSAYLEAGKEPWDLVFVGGQSIRELCGNKYDNYSPEEKNLAYRLETMRHTLSSPDGFTLKTYVWKRNPEGKFVSEPGEKTYDMKVLPNSFEIAFQIRDAKMTAAEADTFMRFPDEMYKTAKINSIGSRVDEDVNTALNTNKDILKKHGLDIYDCVYIGDKTVNEIFEERFADRFKDLGELDYNRFRGAIVFAESFKLNKPIFITNITEGPDGELTRQAVPLTFSAVEMELSAEQKRIGKEDSVRNAAAEILAERENKYINLEQAEKEEYKTASDAVRSQENNYFSDELQGRLNRVNLHRSFFLPASQKIYDDILTLMQPLEAEAMEAAVKYQSYLKAAKLTGSDELRERFLSRAEEIKTSHPLQTYEDYLTSLECTYGLKDTDSLDRDDIDRINGLLERETGYPMRLWPANSERLSLNSYAPLSYTIGPAADVEGNKKRIKEYLIEVYRNNYVTLAEQPKFADLVMIDGVSAFDKLPSHLKKDGISMDDPKHLDAYTDEIARHAADAIRDGKAVDFYIARLRRDPKPSSVPIHIKSSDTVRVSEENARAYREHQENGHRRMQTKYGFSDIPENVHALNERVEAHADSMYEELKKDDFYSNNTYGNGYLFSFMHNRYFPEKVQFNKEKAIQQANGGTVGDIPTSRTEKIIYVINALCHDAMRQIESGEEGYSIEQIMSVSYLEEEKKKYADEFRKLCEDGDVTGYYTNLLKYSAKTMEFLRHKFPPEEFIKPGVDLNNIFEGKSGAIFYILHDNFQNLSDQGTGLKVIEERNIMPMDEANQIINANTAMASCCAKMCVLKNKDLQRNITDLPISASDPEDLLNGKKMALSALTEKERYQAYIRSSIELGLDAFSDVAEIDNGFSLDLLDTDLMTEILNKPYREFYNACSDKTILDHVFVDYEKIFRIQNGMEDGNINNCVFRVNNAEEKEALRIAANEKSKDFKERKAISQLFDETAKERRKLFEKEVQTNGLYEKQILKDVSELTENELQDAARLYDKIFGKIHQREGVRTYLNENQGVSEFDLFKVGDKSVHAFLNPEEGPVQGPLSEAEIMKRKAEIIRLTMDGAIPVTRDLIRKNAENHYVVAGKEDVIGSTYKTDIVNKRPELKDLQSYKEYRIAEGMNPNGVTYEDWLWLYHDSVRHAVTNPIAKNRVISESRLNDSIENKLPEEKAFERLKTIYGPKAKFVTEWSNGNNKVYDLFHFESILKDCNQGNFTDDEFATLSYLAAFNKNFFNGDNLLPAGELEDKAGKFFYQKLDARTASFMKNRPDALDSNTMKAFITPARKGAEDAIASLEGRVQGAQAPDAEPMADLIANGMKEVIGNVRMLESIQGMDSKFMHYASILKNANDLLNKEGMEELRDSVYEKLGDNYKHELETILELKDLQMKKTDAEKTLEDYIKGNIELSHEQHQEKIFDIANFNDFAEKWYANYKEFTNTIAYKNAMREIDNRVNAATNAGNRAIADLIKYEKDAYIKENCSLDENIHSYLFDQEFYEARTGDLGSDLNNLDNQLQKIKEKINTYIEKTNISLFDKVDKTKPALSLDEAKEKQKQETESYRFVEEAKKILLKYADEDMLKTANKRFRKRMPNASLNVRNVADFNRSIALYSAEESGAFFEELFAEISKNIENRLQLADDLNGIKLPNEMTKEEMHNSLMNHTMDDQLNVVRLNLANQSTAQLNPQQINALNAQIREDYTILENVRDKIASVNVDIADYYGKLEPIMDFAGIVDSHAKKTREEYKNGLLKDFREPKNSFVGAKDSYSKVYYVREDKRDAIKELRNHPVPVSDELKSKIHEIVNLMNQEGLFDHGGGIVMEEDGKVYSFAKLMQKRGQLIQAVNSGNMQNIKTANTAYDEEYEKIKRVFDRTKELFPNPDVVPMNMDSSRNSAIPPEFSLDLKTTSIMNSLFLLGEMCREHNISLNQYLNNPIDSTERIFNRMKSTKGFNASCAEEQTCSNAIIKYLEAPEPDTFVKDTFGDNQPYYAVVRPMESLFYLESDKEKREEITRQGLLLTEYLDTAFDEEKMADNAIKMFFDDENKFGEKANERFRQGLKAALLSGGPLEKKYLPLITVDAEGVAMEDTFNYETELSVRNRYTEIIQMYNQNQNDALQNSKVGKLLEESLFDYLKAHPEDMEKREYKNLENIAYDAAYYLDITSTQKADYLKFKEDFKAKSTQMADEIKKIDEAFNKEMVALQKKYKSAKKDQTRDIENNRDSLANDRKVAELEKQMLDLIDRRRIDLNSDFYIKKVTPGYLKARSNQLMTLRNNLANTDYLKIPAFVTVADGEDRFKDCQVISDQVKGNLWSGHIKDLETFKKWKLHEEELFDIAGNKLDRAIKYENELSEEEWDILYKQEIDRVARAEVKLPAGIIDNYTIEMRMKNRDIVFTQQMKELNFILDNRLNHRAAAQNGNQNAQQNEIHNINNINDEFEAIKNTISDNLTNYFDDRYRVANAVNNNPQANNPQANNNQQAVNNNAELIKTEFYQDVAKAIALGIVVNRNGKVPGGNLNEFTSRIANDPEFKKVLTPIVNHIINEKNMPVVEGQERPHVYTDMLISMINDRSIVNAYAFQKSHVNAHPESTRQPGVTMVTEKIQAAEAARPAVPVRPAAGPQPGGGPHM